MHDCYKGRRICSRCGVDIEDGHPCPGTDETVVERIVLERGLDWLLAFATVAQRKREEIELSRKRDERRRVRQVLEAKVADGLDAARELSKMEDD